MPAYLSIGDFSRATHMTVGTLRHYHEIGLLEPAEVDRYTGHLVGQRDTPDTARWRTEIGWPVFRTSGG